MVSAFRSGDRKCTAEPLTTPGGRQGLPGRASTPRKSPRTIVPVRHSGDARRDRPGRFLRPGDTSRIPSCAISSTSNARPCARDEGCKMALPLRQHCMTRPSSRVTRAPSRCARCDLFFLHVVLQRRQRLRRFPAPRQPRWQRVARRLRHPARPEAARTLPRLDVPKPGRSRHARPHDLRPYPIHIVR
ncbi:hypothetical protein EXIGLDRAFT_154097 [Exidia glandulosa HHB12029]|uniref:Uncharacterized protein n=1 Tax=Exidia glandulosa HHB12029 TaxID=1314781 RepID=A0A165QHH3_EXIGL|nr:hypothetical protein EXIGLDRAFT_154097 [Exidia glandulosa HHB12029]